LGNLYDFNPASDSIPYGEMEELDRFALYQLQDLIQKIRQGYARFEFHRVYHALHNYCVVDLSSFYLDILKDRLYTSSASSRARRSAQTVIHTILLAVVRLMAPILSFTAEEVWLRVPHGSAPSVHMESFPEADPNLKDEKLNARWMKILAVRNEVLRVLEAARRDKVIGHPLDARVRLSLPPDLKEEFAGGEELFRNVFIVSQVTIEPETALTSPVQGIDLPGLKIQAETASGEKCERCWVRSDKVGQFPEQPKICDRCYGVVG
jgi:isoleucyl-tRNA synthetase